MWSKGSSHGGGGREKGKLSDEGSAQAQRLNTTRRVSLIRGQGPEVDT